MSGVFATFSFGSVTCATAVPVEAGTLLAALASQRRFTMASTLLGGRGRDRVTGKGHGTEALGPSDTSDSASDIGGAPGLLEGDVIGLDRGTNEDPDTRPGHTAGADIGDAALDGDSD